MSGQAKDAAPTELDVMLVRGATNISCLEPGRKGSSPRSAAFRPCHYPHLFAGRISINTRAPKNRLETRLFVVRLSAAAAFGILCDEASGTRRNVGQIAPSVSAFL